MNNLLDILNKSVNYLGKKNIKNARLTAESIISEVMGMERIMLYAEFERILLEDELKKIREKLNDIVNDDKKISDFFDFFIFNFISILCKKHHSIDIQNM